MALVLLARHQKCKYKFILASFLVCTPDRLRQQLWAKEPRIPMDQSLPL